MGWWWRRLANHSLVVEYDVGQPDLLRRDVQYIDIAVLLRVPLELVIEPFLQPTTGTQCDFRAAKTILVSPYYWHHLLSLLAARRVGGLCDVFRKNSRIMHARQPNGLRQAWMSDWVWDRLIRLWAFANAHSSLNPRQASTVVGLSYACSAWKHSSKVKHGRRLFLSTFIDTQNDFLCLKMAHQGAKLIGRTPFRSEPLPRAPLSAAETGDHNYAALET